MLLINKEFHNLTISERFYMLPIFVFWWAIQLLVFSFVLGWIFIILGLWLIIASIILKDHKNVKRGLRLLFIPTLFPIYWWYVYFRFGRYVLLI